MESTSLEAVEGLTAAGGIGPEELEAVGLEETNRVRGMTPMGGAFGRGRVGVSLLILSALNLCVWMSCAF